ncbi:MAG TPA: thiol:disulfide interchange protein DsbA/DsbL [Methylophilaceae bacterium]|nr:thiol:disulfide interchange protein DsbA/DsbL [Methylophilaceae bacterium]
MKKILTALLLLAATHVMAADPQIGNEFKQTVQAIPTDNPGKIEVMEIFWYGCPHCYHLEPSLEAWVKKLPQDVYFKRVPGVPREDWAPMAKAYYTLEALGLVDKLHGALFDAIHKQRVLNPTSEKGAIDWITKQSGLDRKKVAETYNSFSVNTKVVRAMQIFRASGATGVPSLVIDGKYLTSSTMAGGNQEALNVADYIINHVRQDRASAKH